jgi:ABC-type transporter Mla subunit MlaD
VLERVPAVLGQARGTLDEVNTALVAVRPRLAQVPAVARSLGPFLQRLTPVARRARPVIGDLAAQLPPLRTALGGFPTLEQPAVAALSNTGAALEEARPILRGVRLYGADFVLGILNGLLGISAGNFNKAGHYVHAEFTQSASFLLGGGGLSNIIPTDLNIADLFELQTGLDSVCPGGGNPPAPDGSSPWVADDTLCDPSQSMPAAVNEP